MWKPTISFGLFRPCGYADKRSCEFLGIVRRPELCLPCRDPGIEQMFSWPDSVVTLRRDLNRVPDFTGDFNPVT